MLPLVHRFFFWFPLLLWWSMISSVLPNKGAQEGNIMGTLHVWKCLYSFRSLQMLLRCLFVCSFNCFCRHARCFFKKTSCVEKPVFLCVFPLFSHYSHHHTIQISDVWGFFSYQVILQHQLYVPEFNSILTLSTWGWHQVPQVKGADPQDCSHPSDTNRKSRLSPMLLTGQL